MLVKCHKSVRYNKIACFFVIETWNSLLSLLRSEIFFLKVLLESCANEIVNLAVTEAYKDFDFEFSRGLGLAFPWRSFCGDDCKVSLRTSPGL